MPAVVNSAASDPRFFWATCEACEWLGPKYYLRLRPRAEWLAADDAKSHNTEHHLKEMK